MSEIASDSQINSQSQSPADRLIAEYETSPVCVTPNNLAELIPTLEDFLRRYITEAHTYVELHTHSNIRLLLGYTSAICAIGGSVYAYFVPWPACRETLILAALGYIVTSLLMQAYIFWVEKGAILVAEKRDPLGMTPPKRLTVTSKHQRYSPSLNLSLQYTVSKKSPSSTKSNNNNNTRTHLVSELVGNYFDTEGVFAVRRFAEDIEKWLRVVSEGTDGKKKQ